MRLDVSCRSAFAGETPHVATAHDCERPEAGGCLRLILSYVGDNGEYVAGRHTGLIPLHDNQTDGEAPQGVQFPRIYPPPLDAWEWQPLRPSLASLGASLWYAMRAGSASFAGVSLREQASYILRVAWFSWPLNNFWHYPAQDVDGAGGVRELSLLRHFGGVGGLGWL